MAGALTGLALNGGLVFTLTAPAAFAVDEITDPTCTASAEAGFRLKSDGTWETYNSGGGWVFAGYWIDPHVGFTASDYEVKVDNTSGTPTTGTTGSYLGLGSTRSWTLGVSGCGGGNWDFNVTVRKTTGSPSNGPTAGSVGVSVSG